VSHSDHTFPLTLLLYTPTLLLHTPTLLLYTADFRSLHQHSDAHLFRITCFCPLYCYIHPLYCCIQRTSDLYNNTVTCIFFKSYISTHFTAIYTHFTAVYIGPQTSISAQLRASSSNHTFPLPLLPYIPTLLPSSGPQISTRQQCRWPSIHACLSTLLPYISTLLPDVSTLLLYKADLRSQQRVTFLPYTPTLLLYSGPQILTTSEAVSKGDMI